VPVTAEGAESSLVEVYDLLPRWGRKAHCKWRIEVRVFSPASYLYSLLHNAYGMLRDPRERGI